MQVQILDHAIKGIIFEALCSTETWPLFFKRRNGTSTSQQTPEKYQPFELHVKYNQETKYDGIYTQHKLQLHCSRDYGNLNFPI